MGKTDEQFAKLEGFIEELSVQADKSKVAREKSKQFMKAISQINLDSHENYNVYRQSLKESFSSDLEHYRDKILIIRAISPETANYLEKKLIEYEKICLKCVRDLDNLEKLTFNQDKENPDASIKILDDMKETSYKLLTEGAKIWELIELNHYFLQDILKFLRAD